MAEQVKAKPIVAFERLHKLPFHEKIPGLIEIEGLISERHERCQQLIAELQTPIKQAQLHGQDTRHISLVRRRDALMGYRDQFGKSGKLFDSIHLTVHYAELLRKFGTDLTKLPDEMGWVVGALESAEGTSISGSSVWDLSTKIEFAKAEPSSVLVTMTYMNIRQVGGSYEDALEIRVYRGSATNYQQERLSSFNMFAHHGDPVFAFRSAEVLEVTPSMVTLRLLSSDERCPHQTLKFSISDPEKPAAPSSTQTR